MNRNLYKSDKKLMDQGWRSMQRALDRELPLERRRRPVMLFWILALLLPSAGILTWLVWPALGPVSAPILSQPVAEKQAAPQHRDIHSANATGRNSDPRTSILPARELIRPEKITGVPISSTGAQPFSATPASQTPSLQPAPLEKTEMAVAAQPAPSTGIPDAIQTAIESPEINLPPAHLPTETTTDAPPTAEIDPAKSPATQPANDVAASSAPAAPGPLATPLITGQPIDMNGAPGIEIIRKQQSQNAWSFGASAGVLSDASAGYGGATTGITAEWKAGSRWGLRSGVAYQFQSLRENERPLLTVSSAAYVQATGDQKALTPPGGAFVPNAYDLVTPVYVPVSRLHRVELPFLAYFKPMSSVRLFGGISIGANLYAESGKNSLKNNTVLTVDQGAAMNNLNQQLTDQLRGWDISWNTGIGFRPGRRFSIDLFWQNPLLALHQGKTAFNTSVSAGANMQSTAEALTTQRSDASKGRSQFQFLATVFF